MGQRIEVIDGPDKPALQWAVSYPEREQVHFHTHSDAFDARIVRIDERDGGFNFDLVGTVVSGAHKGHRFTGRYSVETRTGTFDIS